MTDHEARLRIHERRLIEFKLAGTRTYLAKLERRGATGTVKRMVRETIGRLERELLDARARAAGLSVPPSVSRGHFERAVRPR